MFRLCLKQKFIKKVIILNQDYNFFNLKINYEKRKK